MGRGRVLPFGVRKKQAAMLKRIQIKNYRSCKDVTLEGLGHVTALVGRNASGKTNILSAIDQLARMATVTDLSSLFWRFHDPGQPIPSFGCEVVLRDTSYRYSFAAGLESIEPAKNAVRFRVALKESLAVCSGNDRWDRLLTRADQELRVAGHPDPISLSPTIPSLPAILTLFPHEEELLRHVGPLLAFFRATRYYPLEEVTDTRFSDGMPVLPNALYQQWVTQFRSEGRAEDSVLMRLLYARSENKHLIEEIRSLLGPQGLDLIQEIAFSTFPSPTDAERKGARDETTYHTIRFRPGRSLGGGPDSCSFDELSLGTRRVLRIIVSLVVDGSSLMLIEHPEDGIHSGLLKKLMGLLRANADPAQIILSSHAADVFNTLRAEDLRLVTARRGATSVRSLTEREVGVAARFIKEEGSLAEFLESVEEE